MLNRARNVGQRLINGQLALRSGIGSINGTASRHSSALSNTNRYQNDSFNRRTNQTAKQLTPSSNLWSSFYSTNSEQPPNEEKSKYQRSLPRLSDAPLQISAPFLSFIPINLKAWQIRSSLDPEFSLSEFVEGSRRAVEVTIKLQKLNQ